MSKLPNVGTTIFSVMSKMASDFNAINLSQGFPNFQIDSRLIEIYKETLDSNCHQYSPMAGSPLLLSEIGALIEHSYSRKINIDTELLITAGATQAIFTVIQALIERNDSVVILDPCYDCYDPAIILAGGRPIHINLNTEFMPDWGKINDAVTKDTKLLIINNPHNPSGRCWTSSDFENLENLLEKYPNLLILSDEVYEYITFEHKHISCLSRQKLKDNIITVHSFGKTFHITGWKMGYVVANPQIMHEIKKVHQYLVFSVNSVAQATLATYLKETNVTELGKFYQKKRDLFRKGLENSRFDILPCDGTYFQVVSYTKISLENDIDFTKRLVHEFGVAGIPNSVFFANPPDVNTIRFCFAKTDETLTNATKMLCKI